MAKKKSMYYTSFPELDPSNKKAPAVADSSAAKPVAMLQPGK
jgi:hypothetical protein